MRYDDEILGLFALSYSLLEFSEILKIFQFLHFSVLINSENLDTLGIYHAII